DCKPEATLRPTFGHTARPREKIPPGFMDGISHHLICIIENPLDTITMMSISIYIHHPLIIFGAQVFDSHSRIIVDTKSAGSAAKTMMQSAGQTQGFVCTALHYSIHCT